ncbi:Conserved hypothetical protein CHP01589, plant [Cynara cardunculus var. scolymus]|uniref:Uncharacterized protein n=1 Tax=Cynara cardunculus var. scolymus TaxID=59895 RepID=A0A118K5X2_CYNCS|nr:Conserved hypothetical protein CHP01589, plant [Cynara cardunculus var. scolymus]
MQAYNMMVLLFGIPIDILISTDSFLKFEPIRSNASASQTQNANRVQHLIEKCLIFRMSKDECMEALFRHANIKRSQSSSGKDLMSEAETSKLIQKLISDNDAK